MSVDIFGSEGRISTKAVDKNYVDLKYITLVKNLTTKVDKPYVDKVVNNLNSEILNKIDKSSPTVSGNLDMDGNRIYNVLDPITITEAVNKNYVDTKNDEIYRMLQSRVNVNGDTIEGDLDMNNFTIGNVATPTNDGEAANKKYVDSCLQRAVILSNNRLIPYLFSNEDCTGYVVSASSECKTGRNDYSAYRAFNSVTNHQWRVSSENNTNFWIQIMCLKPVKVYRITVRAASDTKLIKWKVQGTMDSFHLLEDLPFVTHPIDSNIYHFEIDPKLVKKYLVYRIFVEEAEGNNPGLTYWQLFTVDPVLIL